MVRCTMNIQLQQCIARDTLTIGLTSWLLDGQVPSWQDRIETSGVKVGE